MSRFAKKKKKRKKKERKKEKKREFLRKQRPGLCGGSGWDGDEDGVRWGAWRAYMAIRQGEVGGKEQGEGEDCKSRWAQPSETEEARR